MCSIFGYIARRNATVNLDTMKRIVASNIERGPHAYGFAWVTADGRLHAFKQAGKLTNCLGVLSLARDARMFIGHIRYATHGDPRENSNNHPHPCDGGWLVHNGVVRNYTELVARCGLPTVSDCDSEAIALLVEWASRETMGQRLALALDQCQGVHCVAGLWRDRMPVARSGNPLMISSGDEGKWFATLGEELPGEAMAFAPGVVAEFTRDNKGDIHAVLTTTARKQGHQLSSDRGRATASGRKGTGAGYCGG